MSTEFLGEGQMAERSSCCVVVTSFVKRAGRVGFTHRRVARRATVQFAVKMWERAFVATSDRNQANHHSKRLQHQILRTGNKIVLRRVT